jgi:N-acetylglucosamine-6-phosphate deacetylase
VVAPGLIDIHIHGAGHVGFEALDADSLRLGAGVLARHGVLRFLITMMAKEEAIVSAASSIEASGLRETCPGIYVEGPFVNPGKRGGIQKKYVRPVDLGYLRYLQRLARGNICMMTFAPELEGARKLPGAMRRLGIQPCVGHTLARAAEVARVCTTGTYNFTHLFNAMTGVDHRRPGAAAFALNSADAWVEINPDGVHVAPEIVRLTARAKRPDRVILVCDAVISAGAPPGVYRYMGRKVIASAHGVHYAAAGTLVGSRILLNKGVVRYMGHAGVALHEAVRAASLNPAMLLGISARTGSLERGKLGDVVLFSKDFSRARSAFRSGRPVAVG